MRQMSFLSYQKYRIEKKVHLRVTTVDVRCTENFYVKLQISDE